MGSSIREVNLVNCISQEKNVREFFGKSLTFITLYIDFEKLKSFTNNIVGQRHTVIFSKNEEENKYYFCELSIIQAGVEYLVTLCEYLKPTLYFDDDEDEYNFKDVYVASDMKCFLVSKDDSYVNYLKARIESLYVADRVIYDLSDTYIKDVFLFNEDKVYDNIYFSKVYITKCLTDILKKDINYDILNNCNKYFQNLYIRVARITPITVLLRYSYEDTINNSEYYSKEYMENEDLTLLKLLKTTPVSVFEGTPIWDVIKNGKILAKDTNIYIKTVKDNVKIHLEAYNKFDSCNIIINAIFTKSIKVVICQPKVLKDGFDMHFAENEISIKNCQIFEIFKKLLSEVLGINDLLSVWK